MRSRILDARLTSGKAVLHMPAHPRSGIPAVPRSTCGRFDTALARKPAPEPADIGKPQDRALGI
jgi:hypothetical protein